MDQLVLLGVLPASVYKGSKGGAAGLGEARQESPTPGGSWTPPLGCATLLGRPPPPLVYIRGQGGTPERQHFIIDLLALCGAPSTTILDNIVAVLRRSPATVDHQDRHHAVVLTKLSHEALLDRSSWDVIELNVC